MKGQREELRKNVLLVPMDGTKERNFVLDSWKRSVRATPPYEWMQPNDFHCHIGRCIEMFVDRGSVKLASHKDTPGIYSGWVCSNECHELYFVYVKRDLRRLGLASHLVETMTYAGEGVEMQCPFWHQQLYDKWLLRYNPLLLRSAHCGMLGIREKA
jgi:GNAT superfamily N-acetyltransferase